MKWPRRATVPTADTHLSLEKSETGTVAQPARKRTKKIAGTLLKGLTPELSRPVAGRRTCASVAHSTWPTPRHGVGLNELLGGDRLFRFFLGYFLCRWVVTVLVGFSYVGYFSVAIKHRAVSLKYSCVIAFVSFFKSVFQPVRDCSVSF